MNQKIIFSFIFLISFPIFAAYDFGDQRSSTLTSKAWISLKSKDFSAVDAFTERCIQLYNKEALKQQNQLKEYPPKVMSANYWALNDVATCYFIRAKAYKQQKKNDLAEKTARLVVNSFGFSQCYDPSKDLYWKISDSCKDLLANLNSDIDFGDYTSDALVGKAWNSLGSNQIKEVMIYTQKCIDLYGSEAKKQQDSLKNPPSQEETFNFWALNDVGTAYFLLGEAYSIQKDWTKALEYYEKVVNNFLYAQCWDPKINSFWRPATKCRGLINKIRAEQGMA